MKDVAAYIVQSTGPITAMKLQKLVYYSQAWHYTWTGKKLFNEPFQAWANGPVAPDLFDVHRGKYMVTDVPGHPARIDDESAAIIDIVLRDYGKLSGAALSTLTHSEPPWVEAREGLPSGVPSSTVISVKAMKKYYGSLNADNAEVVTEIDWPGALA